MKFSLPIIEEVVRKAADEMLENCQNNGVSISTTQLHTQLEWFMKGAEGANENIEFELVKVPEDWEAYFTVGKRTSF